MPANRQEAGLIVQCPPAARGNASKMRMGLRLGLLALRLSRAWRSSILPESSCARIRPVALDFSFPVTCWSELLPCWRSSAAFVWRILLPVCLENLIFGYKGGHEGMHNTLRPTIAVFITNELLEHPDPNVKVVVTFYLTEVTRITAPEAPYDDDVIKVHWTSDPISHYRLHQTS
ncbi:unnamed protein product [Urochloa humidicola]